MSASFQEVMNDISRVLREVYNADAVAVIPGSGTFGMEAVARQFATDEHVLVIRNGWFSYRWTQIFEAGAIPASHTVMKARRAQPGAQEPFAPAPIDEVVATIRAEQPAVVFAPHVETSAGMILPDDYVSGPRRRRPRGRCDSWCSTASRQEPSGSTCRRRGSTC